jgi:hypothetical protein
MPLLPNTPLTDGQDWTAVLANQAFTQVFDDLTQYLGHQPRLADDSLSNAPGNIKARVAAIESPLKVTVGSGLTLAYATGSIRSTLGVLQTIAGGLIAAPNNATTFVWVNTSGVVEIGLVPPVVRILLARVTTVSGVVTLLDDLRALSVKQLEASPRAVKVFGGSNTLDKVCVANEVLGNGNYYFRDFTVPAGISITCSKYAKILCSGNAVIDGTVVITPSSTGGAGYATPVSNGFTVGGIPGSGIGGGSGSTAPADRVYSYAAQPYGSGGGCGFLTGNGIGDMASGGRGGGGFILEVAGTITVNGTISAPGSNGTASTVASGNISQSGGGGGSGGLIFLASLTSVTLGASSTLNVAGGNGGNAYAAISPLSASGGGGGGGGSIVLAATLISSLGSININGGLVGTTVNNGGGMLGGGCGGSFAGEGQTGINGSIGRVTTLNFIPVG